MSLPRLDAARVVTPALSANVVDVLREMILDGTFEQGKHLVENELSAAIGVSRGPVREALAELEREGIVELRRHRGAFVRQLTRDDVEEVYTLRLALEKLAMERALERFTPELMEELSTLLARMQAIDETTPVRDIVELDLAFHDVVYRASEHGRLQRAWQGMRRQVEFFLAIRYTDYPDFTAVGHSEHEHLRDVIVAKDADAARAAIEEHLSGAYHRLLRDRTPGATIARGKDEGSDTARATLQR